MKRLIILIFVCSLFFSGLSAQNTYKPQKTSYTVGNVSFNMVEIVGGNFMMGATDNFIYESDDNEKPAHRVVLHSFAIGQHEVSQDLWTAVMGDNPSLFQNSKDLPVESVSYNDCMRFIAKLNSITGKKFRLPTEAEWEFAARGGNLHENVYCGGTHPGTCATTETTRIWYNNNDWGISCMSGNVWEWCSDWMGRYPSAAQTNPKGPASGSEKVCRGGGWGDPKWKCRSTTREAHSPDYLSGDLGFRLAMDADVEGAIVGYPVVETIKNKGIKGSKALSLCAVELHKDRTVLRFSFSFSEYTYVTIPAKMYLLDPQTGTKYKVKATDRMTYGGGLYFTNVNAGEPYPFSFTFEPVPISTRVLDWISDEWSMEGIHLTPDAPNISRAPQSSQSDSSQASADSFPFSEVDIKPGFNGGSANEFSIWVSKHLVYPEESRNNLSTGRVRIGFTIKTDGSIQDVKVLRSSGDSLLDAEALRVVKTSPKWSPGMKGGKPVNVAFSFPVIFALN